MPIKGGSPLVRKQTFFEASSVRLTSRPPDYSEVSNAFLRSLKEPGRLRPRGIHGDFSDRSDR